MASNKSVFKDNPMISLFEGDEEPQYPFRFGVKKAKLILSNLDDVKEFVKENDPEFEIE